MSDLSSASLFDLNIRAAILRAVIKSGAGDPRIGEPKRQLEIVEAEIAKRMGEFENLTDEELESLRANILAEIEDLYAKYRDAGLVLDKRRRENVRVDELEKLLREKAELERRLAALEDGADQQVNLKTLSLWGRLFKRG